MGGEAPFRIELFDDDVDTIRIFDPETQRSLDKIDAMRLLPGARIPADRGRDPGVPRHAARALPHRPARMPLYQDSRKARRRPASSTTCRCSSTRPRRCSTTCRRTAAVLAEGAARAPPHVFWRRSAERYEQRAHDVERPMLPAVASCICRRTSELRERLNHDARASRSARRSGSRPAQSLPIQTSATQPAPLPLIAAREEPARDAALASSAAIRAAC